MLQSAGLGKLKPNTLLIGYMSKWQHAEKSKVEEYFNIIHDAFSLRYGVGILRLQDGFDITDDVVIDDDIEDGFVENHEPDWYTEDWDEHHKGPVAEGGFLDLQTTNLFHVFRVMSPSPYIYGTISLFLAI